MMYTILSKVCYLSIDPHCFVVVCFPVMVHDACSEPMYTLLGQSNELSYAILENIRAIAARVPSVFAADYKLFFTR